MPKVKVYTPRGVSMNFGSLLSSYFLYFQNCLEYNTIQYNTIQYPQYPSPPHPTPCPPPQHGVGRGDGVGWNIGDIVLYCILKAFLEASGAADFLFVLKKTRSWNFEHTKVSKSVKMSQNS